MDFQWFVEKRKVLKRSSDINFIRGLVESSQNRMEFARRNVKDEPKYAFENAYESVIVLIDGLLALGDYKSYSHEANIVFLATLKNFTPDEIEKLDALRIKRHGLKYYGKEIAPDDALAYFYFLDGLFNKILAILQEKLTKK